MDCFYRSQHVQLGLASCFFFFPRIHIHSIRLETLFRWISSNTKYPYHAEVNITKKIPLYSAPHFTDIAHATTTQFTFRPLIAQRGPFGRIRRTLCIFGFADTSIDYAATNSAHPLSSTHKRIIQPLCTTPTATVADCSEPYISTYTYHDAMPYIHPFVQSASNK